MIIFLLKRLIAKNIFMYTLLHFFTYSIFSMHALPDILTFYTRSLF